uniref:Uncharacterized protein n=1 Tax=Solanum tuberosum TaxID=4113 RepID=M1DFP2_SOLTU
MDDQLSLGYLMQHSYETATHLLDYVVKTNKETEKDQHLATLLGQLDILAQKVKDLEVLSRKKDMYICPHERRKMKKQEGGKIEEVMLLILHKVEGHDRVLEEMRENDLMLNQMTTSHSMLIQLLGSQMDQVLNDLYPEPEGGVSL